MNDVSQALIDRWFGDWSESAPLPEGGGPQMMLWWGKDPEVDAELTHRFREPAEAARAGALDAWASNPERAIALVLLLDQIPRNVFRDTPASFASDARARWVCKGLIGAGLDQQMPRIHRYFALMPLMHSESLVDHDLAVDRFTALIEDARCGGSARVGVYESALEYEHKHREIVARFGRYPHRNRILGRESTKEELAFLEQPGSSF